MGGNADFFVFLAVGIGQTFGALTRLTIADRTFRANA
jgi:hypothetical protein